jgi:hypothetical protein
VVVATCPDFGVITALPQPLRWAARARGRRLARAQAAAVKAAGGIPVPFADLLAPELQQAPELLFSEDQYHPSAAGYALAANQVIPALCAALGEPAESKPVAELPWTLTSPSVLSRRTRQLAASRLGRRPTTGVPAPVVPMVRD